MENKEKSSVHRQLKAHTRRPNTKYRVLINVLTMLAVLAVCTAFCQFFTARGYNRSMGVSIFILGMLVISILTGHHIYVLLSSVFSIVIYVILFVFSPTGITENELKYGIIVAVMMTIPLVISARMLRYRSKAEHETLQAERATALLETNTLLRAAGSEREIILVGMSQITKYFERTTVFIPISNGVTEEPIFQHTSGVKITPWPSSLTKFVCEHIGSNEDTGVYHDSRCQIPLSRINANGQFFGYVGFLLANGESATPAETGLILSIYDDITLVLEQFILQRINSEISRSAETEKLRSNLLRAISHDLRTPLTAISGDADILMKSAASLDTETKQRLYENIYDDSVWLIDFVENLLFITRMENDKMSIHPETEYISDIIDSAMPQIRRRMKNRRIDICIDDDTLAAKVDAPLITQVLLNIIDNAIKHTPDDSVITISAYDAGDLARIEIADNGSGLSETDKSKVFELFYTSGKLSSDERRGMGIGLSLCRSIIGAHGGSIYARDNEPCGAVFGFTLPK